MKKNFENLNPKSTETGFGLWLSLNSMWDTVFRNDLVYHVLGDS